MRRRSRTCCAAGRPSARSGRWRPSGTGDGWRTLTYGAAAEAAAALGQAYLDRGCGPQRPVLLLSGNSLDHLLLTLAGYLTGVPLVPVSTAYSLRSTDHARVRAISALVRPGLVYADDGDRFRAALDAAAAVAGTSPETVVSRRPRTGDVSWTRYGAPSSPAPCGGPTSH
ncbi:AMP-binding protein [Streptomyces sp. NPDC002573]|uniref:AMP-binding protein n=1 Tax=Streptomyces sp. NPDC002573 TaxID=3364651 RepID=UPI003692196C